MQYNALVDAFFSAFLCSATGCAILPAKWKTDRNENILTDYVRDWLYKAVVLSLNSFSPLNTTPHLFLLLYSHLQKISIIF